MSLDLVQVISTGLYRKYFFFKTSGIKSDASSCSCYWTSCPEWAYWDWLQTTIFFWCLCLISDPAKWILTRNWLCSLNVLTPIHVLELNAFPFCIWIRVPILVLISLEQKPIDKLNWTETDSCLEVWVYGTIMDWSLMPRIRFMSV